MGNREKLQKLESQYEAARQAWNATTDQKERDRLSEIMSEIRQEQYEGEDETQQKTQTGMFGNESFGESCI